VTLTSAQGEQVTTTVLRVVSPDGTSSDLHVVRPARQARDLVFWCPAMGVPARHYLPLAMALGARGIAMAMLEWRGVGSSNRRAGRACSWGYRELLTEDIPAGLVAAREACPDARIWLGGHSLGSQMSVLFAGLHPHDLAGLLLVAGGSPYWRCFSRPWLIRSFCALLRPLDAIFGYYPGRTLGFAGNEARGLMDDWSRSASSGRYEPNGLDIDFAARLGVLALPILALRLRDDWLAPASSRERLLAMLPAAGQEIVEISPPDLGGAPADHFAWMKAPGATAECIASRVVAAPSNHHFDPEPGG